ncbi:MAG: hypothetical protein K2Y18_00800 [Alphaproteobacteria bacterium]|nr:hypothetical protein [Alphaproteobacteria bacterium]
MKKYVAPFLTVLFFGNLSVSAFGIDQKKTVEEKIAQEKNRGSSFDEAVFRAKEHLKINPNLTDQELLELGCTKDGIRIARRSMR